MCPTLTVGSFFRHESSTFLSAVSFLFVQFISSTTWRTQEARPKRKRKQNKQNLDNTLRISPKPPPPHFFSALCDFFETFWIAPKGPPFICFDISKHNGCQKIPKGPPFTFFGTVTLFKNHILNFFWAVFLSP